MKTLQFAFLVGVTVAGTAGLLFYLHKRRARKCPPVTGKWQYVGTLDEIVTYPIKSCAGIELNEATCKTYGLEYGSLRDRMLILIDDEDCVGFVGRRPEMWKIKSEIIGDNEIQVTAPTMEPLLINISQMIKGRREVVKCFDGMRIPLIECDDEYGRWFSKFLLGKDTGLRLFVCLTPVPKKKPYLKNVELNPFLVVSDESVADLNARIANKVHHWQFRGNFLISTNVRAFAEDNWKWMRIGNETVFRYKAPCYRCILPNIDPFTCERSPNYEPLRTLKRYRMRAGQVEPEMGIYFELHREGVVKRGDAVHVIT